MHNIIANALAVRYGGTIAKREECEMYLREDQHFLFGLNLDDPKANFKLLSDNDFQNMSYAMRTASLSECCSPFGNLKLIVYIEGGEINFKLLHGMASRLVFEMATLCEHPELFVGHEPQ